MHQVGGRRPLLRRVGLVVCALAVSVVMTLVAAVALGGRDDDPPVPAAQVEPVALAGAGASDLAGAVASLQARLADQPGDHRSWSTLSLAYVEQARVSADPSLYAKAAEAADRAAELAPSDDLMLSARATLAVARHEFAAALDLADQALERNPSSATAHTIRSDALTELGRYDDALAAARSADRLRPGPSTFARLSYAFELRGDLAEATRLMALAADTATSPAERSFASSHLGELARAAGDPAAAERHFADALAADPSSAAALAGQARQAAGAGDLAEAERLLLQAVGLLPLPEYAIELGELYLAQGRDDDAEQQFAVARAASRLAQAGGVGTDLESALFEADHGSPARAVDAARAEWSARESIHAADALAWALHSAGRDAEALAYAERATALGTRDALLLYHRGVIEAALGNASQADLYLAESLAVSAGSDPWRDGAAETLLSGPGGPDRATGDPLG